MPPKLSLALDETALSVGDPSYIIGAANSDLVLRAFLFQNGTIFKRGPDGAPSEGPGAIAGTIVTADDIDWTTKRELGRGASGSVYCAVHKQSKIPLAVKCIPISSKAHRDEIDRELTFLTSRYDTNLIVETYGAFWDAEESAISIPMEWMAYSLSDVAEYHGGLGEDVVRAATYQILHGLRYLHDVKKVIHRDIKPSNILLGARGEAKIGDFGVSKMMETLVASNTYVGTMQYMAPERLEEGSYGGASDVWSLGMTVIATATGRSPWISSKTEPPPNLFQLLKKIAGGTIPTLPEGAYTDTARSFVADCLERDPDMRKSCAELLEHAWFQSTTMDSARAVLRQLLSHTSTVVKQSARDDSPTA